MPDRCGCRQPIALYVEKIEIKKEGVKLMIMAKTSFQKDMACRQRSSTMSFSNHMQ